MLTEYAPNSAENCGEACGWHAIARSHLLQLLHMETSQTTIYAKRQLADPEHFAAPQEDSTVAQRDTERHQAASACAARILSGECPMFTATVDQAADSVSIVRRPDGPEKTFRHLKSV